MSSFSILRIAIGALMVFTVFPVRQYARNWMAVKMGDDTPIKEGRLTLNPFAHLDPFGMICMILIGFGWGKSASVNPNNFKCKNKKLGMIAVALAGPVANLLISFVMAFLYVYFWHKGFSDTACEIVSYLHILNLNLAVFLMLPVPGFDGGDIVMQFLPAEFLWKAARYMQYISLAVILLVVIGPLGNLISYVAGGISGVFIDIAYAVVTTIF